MLLSPVLSRQLNVTDEYLLLHILEAPTSNTGLDTANLSFHSFAHPFTQMSEQYLQLAITIFST